MSIPKVMDDRSDRENGDVMAYSDFPVISGKNGGIFDPKEHSLKDSLGMMGRRYVKVRPSFSDTWRLGSQKDMAIIERYSTKHSEVAIGRTEDGELEYSITPDEYTYPTELMKMIEDCITKVREDYKKEGGRMDRTSVLNAAQAYFYSKMSEIEGYIDVDPNELIGNMSDAVYRYTLGLGIFDLLLEDPRLEDIYVDAQYEDNRIFHMCQHM